MNALLVSSNTTETLELHAVNKSTFLTESGRMSLARRLALISVLLVSIGYFVNRPMSMAQTQSTPTPSAALPAKKAKQAKTLFKQYCAKCHGVDGRGETTDGEVLGVPDFTDSEWQEKSNDIRLINSIKHGRGEMPSFENKLSQEQTKILVAYVRAFRSHDEPPQEH